MIGVWSECVDGPIIVPVRGEFKLPNNFSVDPNKLGAALVISQDSLLLTATVDGIPVEPPYYHQRNTSFGCGLVQVEHVESGQIVESKKASEFKPDERGRYLVNSYDCGDGPAVWLGGELELLVPHPDAAALAREIERRRFRIAQYGGFQAPAYWAQSPYLRKETAQGFVPGRGDKLLEFPILRSGEWHADPAPQADELAAALPAQQPVLIEGAPYPENCADYEVPIAVPGDTRLSVSVRRLFLGPRSMVDEPAVIEEPQLADFPEDDPVRPGFLDLPFAAAPVIMAGTISGLSAPYDIHRIAPDARTRVSTTVRNGPAVWLWGPKSEWLLSTPDAERLAADWLERRRIGCRFPISSINGPERRSWVNFPDLKPVDLPQGRAVAPPPSYAPAAPTILPQGHWTPL